LDEKSDDETKKNGLSLLMAKCTSVVEEEEDVLLATFKFVRNKEKLEYLFFL
jgi:hypothetical protein